MTEESEHSLSDRRQGQERIPLRANVWCEDDEVTLYVPVLDASCGGMCVRTGRPFEEGQRVRIGVSSPDGDVEATARVAWSRSKRDTPSAGLHIEEFLRGRDAFLKMVTRARDHAVAEPAVAEPAVAEPAVAEPAVAEPAAAEPGVAALSTRVLVDS